MEMRDVLVLVQIMLHDGVNSIHINIFLQYTNYNIFIVLKLT